MTKFCYSDYLSQFRNPGRKLYNVVSRRREDSWRGDGTIEPDLLKENKDGWIPLHDAALCGQTECLKTLLKGSADKRTLQEQTSLLLAVSCEHLPCVRCLLELGADPDISNNNKETALYKACELENLEMVSLLLSYGASVNQRCAHGWTALHEAVTRDNTEICDILIGAGAMINPAHTYSIPPLNVAAQKGHMGALSLLGANVNMQTCDGITALHEAAENGHKEVVNALLSKHADANKPANSGLLPLHFAAKYGHHEIVSQLVSVTSRAKLRHSWISPLHLAAEHNRHAAAAVLLKAGADVNDTLAHSHSIQYPDQRATALYFAIANGSTKTAEMLLNAGASLSLDPVSPLLMAARQGCVRSVSLLLERGADMNTKIPSFPTSFPAVVALCMDNLPLLKCLLNHGCDAHSCFTCTYGQARHPLPDINNGFSSCRPMIDLLLEHVGQVQLCNKLTELLDNINPTHLHFHRGKKVICTSS
uniref:Ankyrin repeat and SOCS box containing 2b n=1 Tax=Oryzias sinensis TaxID=183150 RepID=A0A8C8A4S6_9TELE